LQTAVVAKHGLVRSRSDHAGTPRVGRRLLSRLRRPRWGHSRSWSAQQSVSDRI